ncbi:CpaF family protein [bacterium]|nr:CpaF family protein [bacterium]
MALLKQLQKSQKKFDSAERDVFAEVDETGRFEALAEHFQKNEIEPEAEVNTAQSKIRLTSGLPELTSEHQASSLRSGTASQHKRETNTAKVVRRHNPAGQPRARASNLEEGMPWWLTEVKKPNPQIELLVPQARKMLNEIIPSDGNISIDLKTAVQHSVELASELMRGEVRITDRDIEQAAKELYSLVAGKGPLQALYDDPWITDIFIDNHKSIKVIRRGQALETPFYFRSKEEYKAFIAGMLQSVGRALNMSSPIIDCVLDDEHRSRINAVDASLIDGDEPRVCIRVPRLQHVAFYDIIRSKTLPPTLAAWLTELVGTGEVNILVVGPTGAGKTVMTTALLSCVNSDERIITIEDVPEIFVPTAHLEKLVSRPANSQGEGEIKMPQLLRAALRRAPHRIVVGEIRDEEGRLFLRALETGHAGSIATIHAESARDSLWRLLDVVAAYESAPQESIMRRIARSVHIVITMKKIDGRACLVDVSEVRTPVEGEFIVQPLVEFEREEDGKRQWRLKTNHSYWIDRLREKGINLSAGPYLLQPDHGEE